MKHRRMFKSKAIAIGGALAVAAPLAEAQAEDFYAGKTVSSS